MSEIRDRPVFRRILYAQSWEDPAVDIRALEIGPSDDVLAVAASGDNALALLLERPRSVVAIDFNPAQCALLELKIAAIARLSWAEMLEFLGVRPCGRRDLRYARVREALSARARAFWDANVEAIRRGPIHAGRFEGMYRTFRGAILPLLVSRRTIRRLLVADSLEEQRRVYREEWNGLRWRALIRIFFSRTVFGLLGRDPAMFRYVERGDVGGFFLERARHALEDIPIRGNWFVEYALTGEFADERLLPPYLLEENHPRLRALLSRLEIVNDALEDYLPALPAGRFSKFYLSDVFEYMSEDAAERTLRALWRVGRDGGVLSYRNLLAPRARPESMRAMLVPDEELGRELNARDRSFVYTSHRVERIRKPR
jgi:S-adenosylmethionine-diacylglycerol 3-amino-3-carboxypropyl transferase